MKRLPRAAEVAVAQAPLLLQRTAALLLQLLAFVPLAAPLLRQLAVAVAAAEAFVA